MNARMEKYTNDNTATRRTKKNEKLYSEVSNMNIDFVDIDVDNALELNPTKSGKASRADFQKQRELNKILPNREERSYSEEQYIEPKEDRVYDINEILKMARENKLFEDKEKKRLIKSSLIIKPFHKTANPNFVYLPPTHRQHLKTQYHIFYYSLKRQYNPLLF